LNNKLFQKQGFLFSWNHFIPELMYDRPFGTVLIPLKQNSCYWGVECLQGELLQNLNCVFFGSCFGQFDLVDVPSSLILLLFPLLGTLYQ